MPTEDMPHEYQLIEVLAQIRDQLERIADAMNEFLDEDEEEG